MFPIPDSVRRDLEDRVRSAFAVSTIVNVNEIAADVQRRNWHENAALEDLEAAAMQMATLLGAIVAFGREPDQHGHANLLSPGQDSPFPHPAAAVADKEG